MLHSSTLISKPQDDEFGEIFHHTLNRRPAIGRMNGPEARSGNRLDLIRADTLEPESVNWLWPGWLAAGKVHLLAGRAGTGKTTLALKIGATISSGQSWPDGAQSQTGDVVIWSGEDGIQDTLLPRLLAAGADPQRVHFVSSVTDGRGQRSFNPATDTPLLAEELGKLPAPSLLIIDPVIVAVSGDSNKGGDVRKGLQPLADLAEQYGVAILGITHFNKGMAGPNPLDRVTGSLAFGAVARIVWGTGCSAEQNSERRLVRLKSNLGTDGGGFNYRLAPTVVPGHTGIIAQMISWGEPLKGSAGALLAEIEPALADTPVKATLATEWLRTVLADGPRSADEVKAAAEAHGHSWRTVERAKRTLDVVASKAGMNGGWDWQLPKAAN